MLVYAAHPSEPVSGGFRRALARTGLGAEVWYIGGSPDESRGAPSGLDIDWDADLAPASHLTPQELPLRLARAAGALRGLLVSDALPAATILALATVARAGVATVLTTQRGLDTASYPGWHGALGLCEQATLARRFRAHVVTGLLAHQHLASLGCDQARVARGLRPVDVGALQGRLAASADKASEGLREQLRQRSFVVMLPTLAGTGAQAPVLLAAFARLRRTHPHAALLVSGAESSKAADTAAQLGCEDALVVSDDDPWACLALADAVVHLPGNGGWGDELLIAMACGKPAVTSPTVGAAADLVVHGRTGALAYGDDADSVATGLACVAAAPGRLGAAAAQRVGRFDVEGVAERLRALVSVATAGPACHRPLADVAYAHSKNHYGRWWR